MNGYWGAKDVPAGERQIVVIKSGRNRDAWRLHTPTENVLVRNCRIANAHTVFGIGSEISGGVRNVRIENCAADKVTRFACIKTNHRRGRQVATGRDLPFRVAEDAVTVDIPSDLSHSMRMLTHSPSRANQDDSCGAAV